MIKFVVVLLITAFMTGCSSSGDGASNYVKANRYSNCIEKLSDSGNLTYDEMKEVCSEYLKWLKLNFYVCYGEFYHYRGDSFNNTYDSSFYLIFSKKYYIILI